MTHPEILHDDSEGPAPIQPPPPPADPGILHHGGEGPAPAEPPPLTADSPGQEDVLGLRISAALIDLVLLAGLFTIMAAATGGISAANWGFNASLSPGWAAVFVAIAGLYYFALEAWSGQTVGKRLLGVQVYGPGRARPPAGAIAGRTLLRLVDFLPVMYLVGFITMMATGARRQRIGDLAARTTVARAAPARRRGLAAVPLAVVLLAAAGLSAYRATSPGGTLTYRAHGVSFGYPAGWQEESGYTTTSAGAGKLWGIAVGPRTQHDMIVVEAYPLNRAVTAQDLDAITADLQSLLQQVGLAVRGTPEKITIAGMPTLRFRGTGTVSGTRYTSTVVFAFNGTTEYYVDCQYTAGMAAQVQQACNQVTGSFHLSGTVPGAATSAAKAPTAPTSGTEAIYGKLAGPAVMSDNPVLHLTLTGLVATTGTAAVGSAPEKGESLTFRTAVGDLAVTYSSVGAPTGSLMSAKTCLVVVTQTVTFTVDGAKSTGKFAGATGTGKAVSVLSGNLPKLSSGQCNESNNAQLSAKTAVGTFTATAKLTVMK